MLGAQPTIFVMFSKYVTCFKSPCFLRIKDTPVLKILQGQLTAWWL